MRKLQILVVSCALMLIMSNIAFADQYPDKAMDKLGVGIANAVTGVIEIPKTITLVGQRDGVIVEHHDITAVRALCGSVAIA